MAAKIVKISRKTLYQIVKEVRNRPCLWCTDDEFYNNRGRVAVAWEEITELLNLPEPLIRAKWKNMRDLFKRELKKYNINSLDEYTGKWRHIRVMWFLHKPEQILDNNSIANETSKFDVVVKQEDASRGLASNVTETSNDSEEYAPCANRILPATEEPSQVKKRRVSEDDYDMMFLKSLAPYFRQLDLVRKLKIRSTIQDIILTEISAQQSCNSSLVNAN